MIFQVQKMPEKLEVSQVIDHLDEPIVMMTWIGYQFETVKAGLGTYINKQKEIINRII